MRTRSFAIVATALLTTVVSLAALRAGMDAAGIEAPETTLDMAVRLSSRLRSIAARPSRPGDARIVYVGDSTAIQEPQNRSIPARLRKSLENPTGPGFQFVSLFDKGLWAADSFFLAEEVARTKPDLVLLTFNPASTSAQWMTALTHPETSGWLGFDRVGATLGLPLARASVTADRLLFYNALVSMGATTPWRKLRADQSRIVAGWRLAAARLDAWVYSSSAVDSQRAARFAKFVDERKASDPAVGQRERYGTFLDGIDTTHPVLELVGATVGYWTDRGIDTLVFIVPLNVEYFEQLGIEDTDGIARSVASLRTVVEDAGGELLDLHALLPVSAFRDGQGHLAADDSLDAGIDGPLRVARELELRIRSHFATTENSD